MLIPFARPKELARLMTHLAYDASVPIGMGKLQFHPGAMRPGLDGFVEEMIEKGRVSLDYADGRMMKFNIRIQPDGVEVSDGNQNHEYQSWAVTYPTYNHLAIVASKQLADVPVPA